MAPASCYRSMGPVGGGMCALGAGVPSRAGPAAWRWATAGQWLMTTLISQVLTEDDIHHVLP